MNAPAGPVASSNELAAKSALLASLLQLEQRSRACASLAQLQFLAVNDTHSIIPYRQAILVWKDTGSGRIAALSGLHEVDPNAPFVVWVTKVGRALMSGKSAKQTHVIEGAEIPEPIRADWADWLPSHALWLPLSTPDGAFFGGLLLARDEDWTKDEENVASMLVDTYGYSIGYLEQRSRRLFFWRLLHLPSLITRLAIALAIIGAGFIPVTQSALAPAEIVARHPSVVRSPIEGVIERVLVQPNDVVTEGEVVARLDAAQLKSKLDVARKALEVAEAEFRQTAQQAVFDPKSKFNLALLKGRVDQQSAEVAYLTDLNARLDIRAPRAGIAVFDDPNDWIGKPVVMGERIMMVAAPDDSELDIRLPVGDAIDLPLDASVRLFLNVAPDHASEAKITSMSYEASPGQDGIVSYRLKASFQPGETGLRIGLRGTAEILGKRTTLFYYLMRRPLASIRQRLGL